MVRGAGQSPRFAVGAVEQTGGFVVTYNLFGVGVPLEAVDSQSHGDVALLHKSLQRVGLSSIGQGASITDDAE